MSIITESRAMVIHILFGAILFAGLFLRLVDLGFQSLWIDEGFSINAAQAIIAHGYPILNSGKIYTSSPLNTTIIAGAIKIFGLDPFNPWTARLPSVAFGIGVVALVYFFTRHIFQNKYFEGHDLCTLCDHVLIHFFNQALEYFTRTNFSK